MINLFIAVFGSLFSVVNPMGAVPVFLAMTPDYTSKERNKTARNTSIYFVLILTAFFLAGSGILSFFGVSLDALKIAGGLMILSSGYALSSGKFSESRAVNDKVKEEALHKEDISFAPMAMPLLSGPGSISLLISMFSENPEITSRAVIAGVIVFTGFVVYGILRVSPQLFKYFGVAGIKAISRIMGFIVMALGVQYIITGITGLVTYLVA
ncbi:MAG: multiple antibiotic resistance protein [Cognaticolwellia sp.]|jgi:multiple antibiotic resistance protein